MHDYLTLMKYTSYDYCRKKSINSATNKRKSVKVKKRKPTYWEDKMMKKITVRINSDKKYKHLDFKTITNSQLTNRYYIV